MRLIPSGADTSDGDFYAGHISKNFPPDPSDASHMRRIADHCDVIVICEIKRAYTSFSYDRMHGADLPNGVFNTRKEVVAVRPKAPEKCCFKSVLCVPAVLAEASY